MLLISCWEQSRAWYGDKKVFRAWCFHSFFSKAAETGHTYKKEAVVATHDLPFTKIPTHDTV
jgi:hypothetical protein